ncbi:MAG TPA: sigma-70 family RNA polymerase sigma factor [Nannocystaceae bacterium]|nr:sigma-70 family RNA polymerase sigma factor [Nannocystaceae bacterium]
MSDRRIPAEFGQAREQFLALVAEVRPELHRYCARIVGSVVQGEDIVQETLAKAFYAMSMATDLPALRPWLFRVAHNTAIDFLRRYEQRNVEVRADFEETPDEVEPVDPVATRAALSSFLELPVRQRCAVILKDVLGHSLEETADTMGTTVLAVKAALVRGRGALRRAQESAGEPKSAPPIDRVEQQKLEQYVTLFNARNWDGLRSLIGDECRLDLVAKAARRGKEVHDYLGRYAKAPVQLAAGTVEGRPALLAVMEGRERPLYFIFVEWDGDEVAFIRDYKYVDYIADDVEYTLA